MSHQVSTMAASWPLWIITGLLPAQRTTVCIIIQHQHQAWTAQNGNHRYDELQVK